MNMRKLGTIQQDVLKALKQHGGWHPRCGWLWLTTTGTQRTMDQLVRHGYAIKDADSNYRALDDRGLIVTGDRKALEVLGKLGTVTAFYEVADDDCESLSEYPSRGDMVQIKSHTDHRVAKWSEVLVSEIKFGNFYYFEFR